MLMVMYNTHSFKRTAAFILVLLSVICFLRWASAQQQGPSDASLQQQMLTDENTLVLFFFWREGCQFCAQEKEYLHDLKERYPDIIIRSYNIMGLGSRKLWFEMSKAVDVVPQYIPHTFIGENSWVGFNSKIMEEIEAVVAEFFDKSEQPGLGLLKENLHSSEE